ncbi:MAG: hypothetical protein ACYDBH_21185 [Acidobacteriaceae bacterium]
MSWYANTTFWTGAAAVFTAVMAGFTAWSIVASQRQQRRALQQSEQHHQDGFRPVLVLMPYDGVDPLNRDALLSSVATVGGDVSRIFEIHAALQNVGTGPALSVRLTLRAMDIEGYGTSRELAPVQAGETRGDREHPLRIPLWLHDGFNSGDFQSSTGPIWTLVLEYEDVFGNRFHTIHSKFPLQPWTVCGKGPAPPGVDPAVVNAMLQAGSTGRDDGPVSPGFDL